MRHEALWKAFTATGDPLYYLLYRAAENRAEGENDDGGDSKPCSDG